MYQLVSAIAVPYGLQKRWQAISEEDLASLSVKTFFETYRRMQLAVRPAPNAAIAYCLMETIKPAWGAFEGTLAQMFTALGNEAIPTDPTGLALNTRIANYEDVFRANYRLQAVTRGNSPTPTIPVRDRPDIRLTRTQPNTDYGHLFRHSLVSVNGFFHLTDTDTVNGLVVQDANKSWVHCGQNQMGLLSFAKVGQLQCIPITDAMITQTEARMPVVRLPESIGDKQVLMVLGGYLHLPNPVIFQRLNATDFQINFNAIKWPERYQESRQYIDLTGLPLTHPPGNQNVLSLTELYSDPVIRAYLKLSQSFFVVLDTPHLYHQMHQVRKSKLPSMYMAYRKPVESLVTELGRMPEYWSREEHGQWVLTIYNGYTENKVFTTERIDWVDTIDHGNEALPAARISDGFLLEIGRDI